MMDFIINNIENILLTIVSAFIFIRSFNLKKKMCGGKCGFEVQETIVVAIMVLSSFQFLEAIVGLFSKGYSYSIWFEPGSLYKALSIVKDLSFSLICWVMLLYFDKSFNKSRKEERNAI